MKRLFLKVYLGIAAVLVVGTLGTLYILSVGLDAARQRSFEERLIETADGIRERIEADGLFDDEEALFRMSRAARMTFRIRDSVDDLPDDVRDRVAGSAETVVGRDDRGRMQVYSRFSDGRVLVGRFSYRGERRRGVPGEGRPPGPPPFGPPDGPGRGFGQGGSPGSDGWIRTRNLFMLSVIGIPILLVGPAIYFMIRPLDRRIHSLSEAASRFGEGDLDTRAEVRADSFAELAGAFNQMADRIKTLIDGQNDLLRAVSHELRTPMARLFFAVDDAEAAETPAEKDRHLARIQKTLTEMNDLVDELLTYVRLDREEEVAAREPVEVRSVLEEMPELVADLREGITVRVDCGDEFVSVVPRLFKRALSNLVTNAARHARSEVRVVAWAEPGVLRVAVDDDGPGLAPEHRERVLKPFIRVDESRSSRIGGVGLGLAIVNRVMTLHGGSVEVGDSPAGGARFLLTFPSEPRA